MTKFEKLGVEFQQDAYSKEDANRSFQISCQLCCERGLHIACERCAISGAHALTLAAFEIIEDAKVAQISCV